MKLLILGASGGCGQWLVRLAHERGHDVRVLVRPDTFFNPPPDVDVYRGDVFDEEILDRILKGRNVVISALGIKRKNHRNPWSSLASPQNLTSGVTKSLIKLLPGHSIQRIVVVSAAGAGNSIQQVHPVMRWLIYHSNLSYSYRDLEEMERLLSFSNHDWMAVRPTTLTEGGPEGSTKITDYYGLFTKISRGNVAKWILDTAEQPGPFMDRTPMICHHK